MEPTSDFEILRRDPAGNISAIYDSAAPRGFALGWHATDPLKFAPATGSNYSGHLTRDVTVDGPGLLDIIFGRISDVAVGIEYPFKAGGETTVEKAHEVELEGADLIKTSGTGAITNLTTVGTKLSFDAGKVYQAQAADIPYFTLGANNLPPRTAGLLRIRMERA